MGKTKKKTKNLDLKWAPDFMAAILAAAKNHGNEGESDMEVGDLQDLIWELWDALPSGCRDEIMASEKWAGFIADHNGEGS